MFTTNKNGGKKLALNRSTTCKVQKMASWSFNMGIVQYQKYTPSDIPSNLFSALTSSVMGMNCFDHYPTLQCSLSNQISFIPHTII